MTLLTAPAKLTTSLRVTGRRPDGYHLLDAEMVSLDLADEIELSEGGTSFVVEDRVAWFGLPGTAPEAAPPPPGENLVERALALCHREASCVLRKRIPSGAGLGGGSSDAAAILRWAGVHDLELAAALGADVPFCVVGGRARVRGVGEVVEPVTPGGTDSPGSAFLLLTPRLHVSTPTVYAAWDELGGPEGERGNDLEPAALAAYPGLRWWRDLLGAATGQTPRLAGSGGTWFVERSLDGRAAEVTAQLHELAAQIRVEVVAGRESAFAAVALPGASRAARA